MKRMKPEELETIVCCECVNKEVCKSHCAAFKYIIIESLQVEGTISDW